MRIAVTGAGGLIGTALVSSLRAAGHDVLRLVRRSPTAADEVQWDPASGSVDLAGLAGVEAAVHLAGVGIGDKRWSPAFKKEILDSRVLGTRTLVTALTSLDPPPHTLVSAAAIGFYGERGDEVLTETSRPGVGFLPDVVQAWEAETEPAVAAGLRVATLRTGLVMSRHGGAFGQLLPLIRLGVGGPLGNGRQWWSWITLDDEVGAIRFVLDGDLSGPVNLTGPEPARHVDVVRAIAKAVHRPAIVPVPAFALRIVIGEFAGDVLSSQRVLPTRLLEAGFEFASPTLDAAAGWIAQR